MTTDSPNEREPENKRAAGKLLSPEERAVCEQLAAGEAPWSQRVQALLAVDKGATQAEAGQRAGLTVGQVKYWLGKFRTGRTAIFPEALLEGLPDPAVSAELSVDPGDIQKAKEKPKQKSKKDKKSKKAKKGKKAKTGKKSKKKKGTKKKSK